MVSTCEPLALCASTVHLTISWLVTGLMHSSLVTEELWLKTTHLNALGEKLKPCRGLQCSSKRFVIVFGFLLVLFCFVFLRKQHLKWTSAQLTKACPLQPRQEHKFSEGRDVSASACFSSPVSVELYPLDVLCPFSLDGNSQVNSLLYRNVSSVLPASSHLMLQGRSAPQQIGRWSFAQLKLGVVWASFSKLDSFSKSKLAELRLRSSCNDKSLNLIQLHLVDGQQKQRSTPMRTV